jgi:hypothetical protein
MRGIGFDPLALTADASLNQVVIGDCGGPGVAGMRAVEACSRDAMLALAAEHGLTGLRADRLADGIAAAAASPGTRAARAAAEVLAAYGRRLAALIVTLRDPRTPGAQARTPARRGYLSHWLTVDSVWLGGGLLAAGCGPAIVAGARAGAAAAARPCRVALTPYPAIAPLLGAALRGPADRAAEVIAVADLGHTSIKTAIAERRAAAVTGLWLLKSRPAPSGGPADAVEDAVASALAPAVRRATDRGARRVRVIVSVAAYVSAGAPADDGRSSYGCLAGRGGSLRRRLGTASGTEVSLEFVHDGTAAAATAGAAGSATIIAGTTLGSGFRPAPPPPSCGLSPGLRVGAWPG